jgi:hypothetical protein
LYVLNAPPTGGFDWYGVLYLAVALAIIFLPVLLARRPDPPPADGGSDDDRGGEPRKPPQPPTPPAGGPPLPDADQSRKRLRDHGRLADLASNRLRRSLHRPRRRSKTLA